MFLKLLSIEWTRLSRRPLMWIIMAGCILWTALNLSHFYKTSLTKILDGALVVPGMAFDLANSLDQMEIAIPFTSILTAFMMGSDYSQRTNRIWLMRASRASSLLAKFTLMAAFILATQVITLTTGGIVGFYYKTFVIHTPDVFNVNCLAALAAPFYMTLVSLPYISGMLMLTIRLRSTLFSAILGLGYTQILENLLTGISHGADWTKWLFTNIHFSASFLLNSIGNRRVEIPAYLHTSIPALATAVAYTSLFLTLAVWLYHCQDVRG